MSEPRARQFKPRDTVIAWLCNFLMRFASPNYRAMIGGSIRYGLKAAAADAISESVAPKSERKRR